MSYCINNGSTGTESLNERPIVRYAVPAAQLVHFIVRGQSNGQDRVYDAAGHVRKYASVLLMAFTILTKR